MSDEPSLVEKRFERRAGLTIAVLAAVLAVNDLFGGKFGEDEILGANEKADAYSWYQSKSQKQTLHEHQRQLLQTLERAGVVPAEHQAEIATQIASLTADIERYDKEKKEILLGSDAVGEANWMLEDETGQKGQIIGANVWKETGEVLDAAGNRFDLGTLFLQLCLVLGAVSLVLDDMRLKTRFFQGMVACGIGGTIFTVWALMTAFSI
ncbi:MAG: DUF4337 domain-containing protein [Myxococcota bacterium]